MYCSLSFLVVLGLIGVFLEVKGFAGYNLFETDNLDGSAASFPDLGSDNIAWDDPIEEPEPDKNIPFDTSPPLTGDDTNPDSIVADCATDRLGARDETIICPTNDFKSPELPTLGGVTDKFIPPDEQDNPLREMSPLISPVLAGDDSNCPPGKYFRLCCICDGFFDFSFCQDCLQMAEVGACFSPHIENTEKNSFTNLDELLAQFGRNELNLNMRPQGGTIAQTCEAVVPPVAPLPPRV